MEPTSGGLDRTEPSEPTATPDPDSGTEHAARKPHRGEKALLGAIVAGSGVIAGIGFTGSYAAVRSLAWQKGFAWFSYAFPIGVDVGIAVILALDVYLTWKRMAFWPLRMIAWVLTAATVAFNASISWPDPVGTTMHGVIPLLFVIVVEAARHVVRRSAELSDDHRMDSIRWWRWVLSPVGTFRLWRRMKLWEIRSYEQIVHLERARVMYRKDLRHAYGRRWRTQAPLQALRPLRLAGYGIQTPALLQSLADNPHWTIEPDDRAVEQEHAAAELAEPAELNPAQPHAIAPTEPAELNPAQPHAITPTEPAEEQPHDPAAQIPPAFVEEALLAMAELRTLVAQLAAGPADPQHGLIPPAEPLAPTPAPADPAAAPQPWWRPGTEHSHPAPAPAPEQQVVNPALAPAPLSYAAPILPSQQTGLETAVLTAPVGHGHPAEPAPTGPAAAMAVVRPPVEEPATVAAAVEPEAAEELAAVALPAEPGPAPAEDEGLEDESEDERTLSKKDRARLVYVEHKQAGRELTRGRLAELVGYAHEGSARTVYKELQSELGPIVVRATDPQLPVELASVGASA